VPVSATQLVGPLLLALPAWLVLAVMLRHGRRDLAAAGVAVWALLMMGGLPIAEKLSPGFCSRSPAPTGVSPSIRCSCSTPPLHSLRRRDHEVSDSSLAGGEAREERPARSRVDKCGAVACPVRADARSPLAGRRVGDGPARRLPAAPAADVEETVLGGLPSEALGPSLVRPVPPPATAGWPLASFRSVPAPPQDRSW